MNRRSAFTLLELILSLLLMSTLLAATWTLLGIFQNRMQRSQQQTEQWQLIRSLQQTLHRDLDACILPASDNQSRTEQKSSLPATLAGSNETDHQVVDDTASPRARSSTSSDPFAAGPEAAESDFQSASDSSLLTDLADSSEQATGARQDPVTQLHWFVPETVLIGTATGLIVDTIPPKMPAGGGPPTQAPSLETANLPDVVQRVIYSFADPRTAFIEDRPPGLVRCRLTLHQQTVLQNLRTPQYDLMTLVRPYLDQSISAPRDAISEGPLSAGSMISNSVQTSRSDSQGSLAADASRGATGVTAAAPDLALEQSIDYVPEVAVFSLRYFDGASWRSQWDSRQQKGLPVAVEMRFRLKSELPEQTESDSTNPTGDPLPADDVSDNTTSTTLGDNALDPIDDQQRSALTEPPEDHRYLIPMQAANGRQKAVEHSSGSIGDLPW